MNPNGEIGVQNFKLQRDGIMGERTAKNLEEIYKRLYARLGPQHWWPGKTRFEVMVGAILTQNTNWENVEKAIVNLRRKKLLNPKRMRDIRTVKLAALIRPAGYFNVKAKRLKNFVNFLFKEYDGDLDKMAKDYWVNLRIKLLSVNGIGPETADSILLYALQKPVFVVDAYTKRMLARHNLMNRHADYQTVQGMFMDNLSQDTKMYNEYHALLVRLGKDLCKSRPLCEICPLNNLSYSINYKCYSCNKPLPRPQERYHLNFDLFMAPEITPTEAEVKKDSDADIKSLTVQMGKKAPAELPDDIYSSQKIHLCKKCRDIFHTRFQNREFV